MASGSDRLNVLLRVHGLAMLRAFLGYAPVEAESVYL